MFLALHPMESILISSFVLLEHLPMLLTSTLAQKLLKQGYRYHKLRKTFSKFYRRYYDLISKFQVGLKSLFRQGLSEPEFYGDLVYKLKKIVGSNNFSAQFIKIISHYKKIMYCSRRHAWWSTQSRVATLLSSFIAHQWVGLQTL